MNPSFKSRENMLFERRKQLFGDCALIEIIHLHDCLRGALSSLQQDVNDMTTQMMQDFDRKKKVQQQGALCAASVAVVVAAANNNNISNNHNSDPLFLNWRDLERRVAGRFKVIWSVFRAHSSAEDEFIWPALRSKMHSTGAPNLPPSFSTTSTQLPPTISACPTVTTAPAAAAPAKPTGVATCGCGTVTTGLVQEEYEEDHADEERMFSEMDALLSRLRELINADAVEKSQANNEEFNTVATRIRERTRLLSDHLMQHLEKEETQCMPLVVKHLSKAEIHDLVGNIMGKRSADTIAQIMTMAVQSLPEDERQEMIQYMKQSMQNTFFDRWLSASGWGQEPTKNGDPKLAASSERGASSKGAAEKRSVEQLTSRKSNDEKKRSRSASTESVSASVASLGGDTNSSPIGNNSRRSLQITSQAELEKLIRAIATNNALTPQQKNATIQGLRDSVWKSNQREKQRGNVEPDSPPVVAVNVRDVTSTLPFLQQPPPGDLGVSVPPLSANSGGEAPHHHHQQQRRAGLPPSAYYKKKGDSKVELVWKNDGVLRSTDPAADNSIPLFSPSELAPTFHDGATGAVLGCPHYARGCKLRHPSSGRLYTCRLCCDQSRELPSVRGGDSHQEDEKLDRYAVSEVMCMICNTLQPAEDRCLNPDCESRGRPFAKYFCRICHLYDDGSRPIFHCPYCNTCRLGHGLGIDYRHCMRCNACVSLDDKEHHCIPQKLQGTCPICHDTLFQSTEPLRGLKCGHVMHLTCFTQYRRTSYSCPLCMRSVEDMRDHFALLDAAIRMQPMPANFLHTKSNIYCQDCCKTGQVQYHFVGQKCPHCSSYNTREMGRVTNVPSSFY